MSLQPRLFTALPKRIPVLSFLSRRHQTQPPQENKAPYRPWPLDYYSWPGAASVWTKKHVPQSEQSDQYEKEEIYLDEIEERMRKYDKKYSQSDKIKSLYNEFGWENRDDRAFSTYGGGLSGTKDELQYGRGKKIDPSHYINPDFVNVSRQTIPPVQYLTPEQIRRSRGSLASFREVPPETKSIFKTWNPYVCLGTVYAVLLTKEYYVFMGHDMIDAILLWGVVGAMCSVVFDWFAWWNVLLQQEQYDKDYFALQENVKNVNQMLDTLHTRPNELLILPQLKLYRQHLSEKVLNKTTSNRVARLMDATLKKLQDKVSEEQSSRREAENTWKRLTLERTLKYFENEGVKNEFMKDALKQFSAGDNAKLGTASNNVTMQSNVFVEQYKKFYEEVKDEWLNDQKQRGSLSWIFVPENERQGKYSDPNQKFQEYNRRIQQWESTHNKVDVPAPSFS